MRSLLTWKMITLLVVTLMEGLQSAALLGERQLRGTATTLGHEVLARSQALAATSDTHYNRRALTSSKPSSSRAGSANVCKPNPGQCTIYQFAGSGFGSNMNGLLLAIACYGSGDIVVDMKLSSYTCGARGLDTFFTSNINSKHSTLSSKKCQKVANNNAHQAYKSEDTEIMFMTLGAAVRRVWLFTPEMQRLANKMTDFTNMFHSNEADRKSRQSSTLAVHVRGGDKVKEGFGHNANGYLNSTADIIKTATSMIPDSDVIKTCIVFGDDLLAGSHVLMALAKHFKCAGVQVGGTFAGHEQHTFNAASKESKCHDTKKMIAEIHAMSTADYFLGSYASNVPRLVHVLRSFVYGKDASTSGDIFGRLDWTHNWQATPYKKQGA